MDGAGRVDVHQWETVETTVCWADTQLKRVALENWAVDNQVEMEEGMEWMCECVQLLSVMKMYTQHTA